MRQFRFSIGKLHMQMRVSREDPEERFRATLERFHKTNVYFEGPFKDWDAAKEAASGYDAPQILEKAIASARAVKAGEAAYERDTVLFQTPAFSHPLLSWLLLAAASSGGNLHVIDFGGALGSLYFQNRAALSVLNALSWCVVEQDHIASAGAAEFSDDILSFSSDLTEACAKSNANFLLLSGVLQYLPDPMTVLRTALSSGVEFVAIDRTMARTNLKDEVFLQHVPEWIYEASYPVRFLNAEALEETFAEFGYSIIEQTASIWSTFGSAAPSSVKEFSDWGLDVSTLGSLEGWPYLGWFLRRQEKSA